MVGKGALKPTLDEPKRLPLVVGYDHEHSFSFPLRRFGILQPIADQGRSRPSSFRREGRGLVLWGAKPGRRVEAVFPVRSCAKIVRSRVRERYRTRHK